MEDVRESIGSRIFVGTAGTLTWSELTPLLEELNKRHVFVNASVTYSVPPAADTTEIVLALIVGATSVPYLKDFFGTWGAEDAKTLRAELMKTCERGKHHRSHPERRYIAMTVERGRARFFFNEAITDDEFLKRIRAADSVVKTLSDDELLGEAGPRNYGFHWNLETESWEGNISPHDDSFIRRLFRHPGSW